MIADTKFVSNIVSIYIGNVLTSLGFYPKRHVVWSDGCASQFKGASPWFFVSRYASHLDIILVCRALMFESPP